MEDITPLVSMDDAKRQLRITSTSAEIDADVDQKLMQATSLVLRMVGELADASWDEATAPASVHTAILWTLDVLYMRPEDLSTHMQSLAAFLMASGFRDPAVV
jgi:hypothetical protein